MSKIKNETVRKAALDFHEFPKPGKLEIRATKPLANQSDLAKAYSPGVAEACLEIKKDFEKSGNYTSKSNLVAVISNGTAVLGLGNIGALAAKPNCVQTERLSCPPHFGGPQSDTTGILMLGQRPPMNRRRSYFFGRGRRWDLTPQRET